MILAKKFASTAPRLVLQPSGLEVTVGEDLERLMLTDAIGECVSLELAESRALCDFIYMLLLDSGRQEAAPQIESRARELVDAEVRRRLPEAVDAEIERRAQANESEVA